MSDKNELLPRQKVPINNRSVIDPAAAEDISCALNTLLADVFCLYIKTKNFHWHMSGPHFRDYHLLLDEHADQIFGLTDEIAERVRKIGGTTIRSIGNIARLQRIPDNDADYVNPGDMLSELHAKELSRSVCARCMFCVRMRVTLRQRAYWKTGLIKRSVVRGFCLSQPGRKFLRVLSGNNPH